VSIYDVLKDDAKRARYDQILEHGLPDWRQPIYYFRRVRKLTMYELSIALSIIISIGHYFVMWAQYFEKRLTLEDHMGEVRKKLDKKQKKKNNKGPSELDEIDAMLTDYYENMKQPSLKQTLPVRFTIWSFKCLCQVPFMLKDYLINSFKKKEIDSNQSSMENEENEEQIETENERKIAKRKAQSNKEHLNLNPKNVEMAEKATPVLTYELKKPQSHSDPSTSVSATSAQTKKSKEWSNKEKSDLIKAIAKYPAGTVDRWNRIAEFIGRSTQECIQMDKQIKENFQLSKSLNAELSALNGPSEKIEIKDAPTLASECRYDEANGVKTLGTSTEASNWSQDQQSQLEKALRKYGKDLPDRWELIADCVSGKSKDDCIQRFKVLCSSLKKKQ